jgi:anti-sigma regulatory factor (Ser/Thr protein kinase)
MELRLEIPNLRAEYEPAKERLLALFRAAELPDSTVDELELVLEELLVNIIAYAYMDEGAGNIVVSAAVERGAVTLEFRDFGRPFDPLEREEPDLDAPVEDRPIGGLGIFLVKEFATSVRYERTERENVLTVVKQT